MITLGGVVISDDMYLDGLNQSSSVAVTQVRTIEGISKLTIVGSPGGRSLTLGTSQLGNAVQGIWCQSVIDQIKDLEALGTALELSYHGAVYNVVITGTSDFTQMFQFEPAGPNKKFTGKIQLIEA